MERELQYIVFKQFQSYYILESFRKEEIHQDIAQKMVTFRNFLNIEKKTKLVPKI